MHSAKLVIFFNVAAAQRGFFREIIFVDSTLLHRNSQFHITEILLPSHSVEITEIYSHNFLAKIS